MDNGAFETLDYLWKIKETNESKNMNKKLIRLTESDLHRIVKESVGKILKESSWADGQEMIQAYHIATVGAEDSSQEEANFAYQIYDRLTHNEMTADEAIRAITNGDLTTDTEPEVVPRDTVNFGTSNDGRYFLTYDNYTGAFDVWERTDDIVDEAYKPLGAKYSDEHISEVTNAFHRQIANLLRFMNAYSDTILSNNVLDEDSYDRLFNQLAEIDSYAH